MGFRLAPKLVTLNDLKQRNGHFQVIRAEFTEDETGRETWRKIINRICIANLCCCHYCISCGECVHFGDKFTVISFASAFIEPLCLAKFHVDRVTFGPF